MGFRIIYLHLAADSLSRQQERAIISCIFHDDPSFKGLFVVSNADQSQWEFVNGGYVGKRGADSLLLRRMRVGIGERVRAATERIARIALTEKDERLSAIEIQARHDEAFSVEQVQKEFFRTLQTIYNENVVPDIQKGVKDEDKAREAGLIFLNRLIFLYFIQKKGWLTAMGNPRRYWPMGGKTGESLTFALPQ